MRVSQEPAYVLHHHDYTETSLLLELFTRRHGRLGVIAKGARRARSPLHTSLFPFNHWCWVSVGAANFRH